MADHANTLNTTVDGLAGAIGRTPLIRLRRASEMTGCTVLGKAEFMNPGGSVKDRAGLAIIEDAERRGVLRPGGTIVEGTAGNTGIGLTLVANARGYRSVIVMPETQSREKIDFLRMIGAEQIALMPPGSFLINTARESLVDESALLSGLRDGRLAGVALDVNEPDGPWREMVDQPNLILTPHLAGATRETLVRGAEMLASEVQAFLDGRPLRWER